MSPSAVAISPPPWRRSARSFALVRSKGSKRVSWIHLELASPVNHSGPLSSKGTVFSLHGLPARIFSRMNRALRRRSRAGRMPALRESGDRDLLGSGVSALKCECAAFLNFSGQAVECTITRIRKSAVFSIGVGNGFRRPLPPNRTGGFPAYGSPVGGYLIGNLSRFARPCEGRTARRPRRRRLASACDRRGCGRGRDACPACAEPPAAAAG